MSALQRLDQFALAPGQRGRSALTVQLWWLVQMCIRDRGSAAKKALR